MMRVRLLTPLLALLLLAACSVSPPPPEVETVEIDGLTTQVFLRRPSIPTTEITCPSTARISVRTVAGRTLNGAEYLFYVPVGWRSGSLVLYARGYLPPSDPVGFPKELPEEIEGLRDALVCQGFAVGASSYSANGLAIKEGIQDTHLLNPLFAWHFGMRPARTYIMGQSMGGLISVALMELFPRTYDGAFPMCGPTAGSLAQLQYLGHVRVLVDYFFPGLFEVDAVTPTSRTLEQVEAAIASLIGHPDNVPALLGLASIRLPGSELFDGPPVPLLPIDPAAESLEAKLASLGASLKEALYYYVVGMQDVLERGRGQPFDNRFTTYTSVDPSFDSASLNVGVDRYRADSRALAYWALWYQPKGWAWNPTINLHTVFDPAVPYAHAFLYEGLAAAMGNSGNLLTLPVPRYGHCAFTPEEVVGGFGALVQWVETGHKPSLP
jgi:hypothetical protein